jgi:hypothetical protein
MQAKPLNVISLGAGRQSTFMLLKCLTGELLFKPDFAVFADTQSEPAYVYSQLAWLTEYVWSKFHFKIYIATKGNLIQATLDYCSGKNKNGVSLPFFSAKSGAPMHRQCTDYYKIRPVRKLIRSMYGKVNVNLAIGISLDEIERIKGSQVAYITNVYPLVAARIKIDEIIAYFEKSSFPSISKSSCLVCPFHSDAYWRRFKKEFPEEFEIACIFDDQIRDLPKATHKTYIHKSLQPLRSIDFTFQNSLFPELIEECSGMCGL